MLASLKRPDYDQGVEKDQDRHSVSPISSLREAPYRPRWRTHGKQSARQRRRLGVSWP